MDKRHIYLIGFMGAGKSTVAAELRKKTGRPVVETDAAIEKEQGKSISAIFAEEGEEAFRDRESAYLSRLREEESCIVSCGGGMILREENRRLMKESGWVFCLSAAPETIYKRVKDDTNRPLLSGHMDIPYIAELMDARRPLYEAAADFTVQTDGRSAGEIADEIIEKQKEAEDKRRFMKKTFAMGNEAIALGALAAGVFVVAGYPGTPSTEVLETVSAHRGESTYVEWSVNEKAAMEVAAGASYAGARTLVTCKQVGLNVATDPLMSLSYIGVKGGMVVMVADDPGPISSQTEQDSRTFAAYAKVPVFDPASVQEAYDMMEEAYEISERYETPVLLRSTTRISHGYADIWIKEEGEYTTHLPDGFKKDEKWVIFPKISYADHIKVEKRVLSLAKEFSAYPRNEIRPSCGRYASCRIGIAAGGISFDYVMENTDPLNSPKIFKVATPYPFPEEAALRFLKGLDRVLCVEELDPVIERSLTYLCGKYHLDVKICGKLSGHIAPAGENSVESVRDALSSLFGRPFGVKESIDLSDSPALPQRPPVLCAGCPHRAAFYAIKQAAAGKRGVFCGDIGCYTLGNAAPLDMTDTCLCMGAGITIAQGIGRVQPDTLCFSFTGDSTFFASGITGIVNACYNQANLTAVILDNGTTAMTGHQPHPGTGETMMGTVSEKVSIEAVLTAIGLKDVEVLDPFDLKKAVDVVRRVSEKEGVKAIIFRSPCIALCERKEPVTVDRARCIGCRKCIRDLGCPAISWKEAGIAIDETLCSGCGLCQQVCPAKALREGEGDE